ncbi:MAG TPA: flavodoxin domain-containing protein [Acidimicrobiales bacterium]|nr:flavodoxin domain-containing protein [Acidimicrobiales bacterium]
MHAVVVYESMYGNTHLVAEAIGGGLGTLGEVDVVSVDRAELAGAARAELLIVGGPTHAMSMSRRRTRQWAIAAARKPSSTLALDADAGGMGLREWLAKLAVSSRYVAAFDTRLPSAMSGRASRRIERELHHHGGRSVAPAESFVVERSNKLRLGEVERAYAWGTHLAELLSASSGGKKSA